MDNNSNITPRWAGFRKLWIIVAIILFLLLVLLMLAGYGPWGTKCDVPPTIVEKVVEKEKRVDNPDLLARIAVLEKENTQIANLKSNLEGLTKSSGLVAGLQAKIKALEAVDLNFENPSLVNKISALEKENGLIDGLKAKVAALEAVDVNFIKPDDNSNLLQKISGLEAKNLAIPVLESRIKILETKEPELIKMIDGLKQENALIPGLKAKLAALEAVDVNFTKPDGSIELLQKISGLEAKNLAIPVLESRIKNLESKQPILNKTIADLQKENGLIPGLKAKLAALEAVDVNFTKPQDNTELLTKISDLEKENGLIPGLKAKVMALEAIDINFIAKKSDSDSSVMVAPQAAKLFFEPGSSRFPKDGGQSMADVIVYLRTNLGSKVSLSGFHDATGNAKWNRRLAIKRSNRVKQILMDAGISDNRIFVEIPTQTLGTGAPEEARRVEVKVLN